MPNRREDDFLECSHVGTVEPTVGELFKILSWCTSCLVNVPISQ